MKKKYLIALVLFVALLGGAFVWGWISLRDRELVIRGKSLTSWLEGYRPPAPNAGLVDEVVREAGTNAIPILLRTLQQSDEPVWKLKLWIMFRKQSIVPINYQPVFQRKGQACRAFAALGPVAKDAVPALIEIYEHSTSGSSRHDAMLALGYIGPEAKPAVPALLQGAATTNLGMVEIYAGVLIQIHAEPDVIMPLLTRCVSSPDSGIRCDAIMRLDQLGKDAKPELVVPFLRHCLSDREMNIRKDAIVRLGQLGKDAKPEFSTLVLFLNDPDPTTRELVTNSLKHIDPVAFAEMGSQ